MRVARRSNRARRDCSSPLAQYSPRDSGVGARLPHDCEPARTRHRFRHEAIHSSIGGSGTTPLALRIAWYETKLASGPGARVFGL